MNRVRVLLADDHALVRAGIRSLLRSIDGVEIVAEAENGQQALERAQATRPDIVLIDISMPGLNGIEATRRIKAQSPDTKVLIVSMHAEPEYVSQALRSGASGYLLKDATPVELELAIQAVRRGEAYLSPRVSSVVVEGFARSATAGGGPLDLLTPRQREILRLIAEGCTTKEIAGRLDVSIKTVETHRAMLMDRLGIRDLAGLVRLAVREGLVSGEK